MVHALIPGKTVGADVSCTLPILNFNDQNRPYRRRTIYWRTADLSAWEAHRRATGRYIGGAGLNAPPTRHSPCCLGNFIFRSGFHPPISPIHHLRRATLTGGGFLIY